MLGKARVWLRERKERIAEKKAARAAEQVEHGHGRFFLLNVPAMATVLAAFVEVYWALLFCIEATGHLNGNFDMAAGSTSPLSFIWDFAFSGNLFVLLGLVAATAPIVMISMVWLPVQFAMRGFGRWRRGTLIAVGLLANAIVIISGTVVMNHNRQEQVRGDLAIEQQAGQNRAAIQAQIDAVNADLDRLTNRQINNEYAATAANVGAVAYQASYMSSEALARSPESRRDIIVRALGAAQQADALRAQRTDLIGQLAAAPTAAEVAPDVQDDVGAGLNAFAQQVNVWRPPLIAVACTLIGILGAWWTLAMLQGLNPRDVLRSGWADESHRIEDLREQEPVVTEPMKPPREAVFDADTGDEMVPVRATWRRKPKRKGVAEQVAIQPEAQPDEAGVTQDGGNRTASSPAGPITVNADGEATLAANPEPQPEAEQPAPAPAPAPEAEVEQSEAPPSDEAALAAIEALQADEPDEPDEREPETNPNRLIAAE